MNHLSSTLAPCLLGVALNYRGLLEQWRPRFERPPYLQAPQQPVLFIKTPNSRNQDGGRVTRPRGHRLQPGPALGVVIANETRRIHADQAGSHIAGYVIVNEFSLPEESYYRPALKDKCRDGFCVVGPMTAATAIPDPHGLGIRLQVNHELRQHNHTSNMVRTVPQLLASISGFMTLQAGDVLITGSPEGRVDVLPGDEVIVEIDGLGQLHNTIVAEAD